MSISRRDFIKLFGISVASLMMTRCRIGPPIATCYAPMPPTDLPPTPPTTARERLRWCWQRFGELAQATRDQASQGEGSGEDTLGQQMVADHRAALDELVASGEIIPTVADLVQEAYGAAVHHVWRSNAPITCYEPMIVDYAPASAGALIQQAEILNGIATQGTIDPQTLATAQAALEHDLAYYALSDADLQALYNRVLAEYQSNGQPIPSFDALQLEISPDARAAAQFIIDLLTGK